MEQQTQNSGISFFSLLAVLFIGLKLTNHIDWSWWWVLSPLWLPATLVLAVILVIIIFGVIAKFVSSF